MLSNETIFSYTKDQTIAEYTEQYDEKIGSALQ